MRKYHQIVEAQLISIDSANAKHLASFFQNSLKYDWEEISVFPDF